MKNIVICHGANSGGWAWNGVKKILEEKGHTVYTPTYVGCGEKIHLANPNITLHTVIQDIVNVIEYERLQNIVLIGHSFGGAVISGVAEQIPDCIEKMIYLDAMVLNDGEAVSDLYPLELATYIQSLVDQNGDGWKLPVLPEEKYDDRLCDHPFNCFTTKLKLRNEKADNIHKIYINCVEKENNPKYYSIFRSLDRAIKKGMTIENYKAGHIPNIEKPVDFANYLHSLL